MNTAVGKLKEIIAQHGPDAVAGLGSSRVTNEESYLFQKLMRGAVGTNNIDSDARLGYAPAQAILRKMFDLSGASAAIDRIDKAGAVLVIGCDLNAEATGLEYRVIKAATKNDASLVVANMRDVKLKKYAQSHLKYRPGGELPLVTGLLKAILDAGLEDGEFLKNYVGNFEELKKTVSTLSLAGLAAAAGVAEADLHEAARLLGGKKSVAVIFGSDVMRGSDAAATIQALGNLALLTGCIGKDAGGFFPIDEKNNTVGLLDMGVAPDSLPGYQSYSAAAVFETAWGKKLPVTPGKDLWQIIEGIEQGEIKALYLLGCEPLAFPQGDRIRRALEKLEFPPGAGDLPDRVGRTGRCRFSGSGSGRKNGHLHHHR